MTPQYHSGSCLSGTFSLLSLWLNIQMYDHGAPGLTDHQCSPLFSCFIFNSSALLNQRPTSVCFKRQRQVCVCAWTDTSTNRNLRATDAPLRQINSPCAATNVNLRKGESVQSLSAAILTGMQCTCSVERGRKGRREVKTEGNQESCRTFVPCSHCLSV